MEGAIPHADWLRLIPEEGSRDPGLVQEELEKTSAAVQAISQDIRSIVTDPNEKWSYGAFGRLPKGERLKRQKQFEHDGTAYAVYLNLLYLSSRGEIHPHSNVPSGMLRLSGDVYDQVIGFMLSFQNLVVHESPTPKTLVARIQGQDGACTTQTIAGRKLNFSRERVEQHFQNVYAVPRGDFYVMPRRGCHALFGNGPCLSFTIEPAQYTMTKVGDRHEGVDRLLQLAADATEPSNSATLPA